MDKNKQTSKEPSESRNPETFLKSANGKKVNSKSKTSSENSNEEVLISIGGFKYRTPGRRQRIVIGSIVIGLNVLVVMATVAYFYIPGFHEYIYNVGR